jgi:CsgH protein
MTAFSATSSRRLRPAAVLLAGVGLAAGCAATTTAPPTASTRSYAPLACTLNVDQNGRMVSFQGSVQANEALSGTYSLTLRGGGTNIRQGGPFSARSGETVTVGQANLSGTPASYDANLSITVNGTTFNCASNT